MNTFILCVVGMALSYYLGYMRGYFESAKMPDWMVNIWYWRFERFKGCRY